MAHTMSFLKARCSWEPGTRLSTGILSLFCLLLKVSHANAHWANTNHIFSSHKIPRNDTFSCDISLCQVNAVQLGQEIFKGFSNSWIKVDCCLSDDSFWTIPQVLLALVCIRLGSYHFVQCDSADLPCYKILHSEFVNVPLPVGMHLKVSPKGCHIFDRL